MADQRPDVIAQAEPFVQQCGPCDFGVIEVGCNCPPGDYRPVMCRLMEEVERLRAELAQACEQRDAHKAMADELRAGQPLTDEPGPDIAEVIDIDGDIWRRSERGRWRHRSGDPVLWDVLVELWGPIRVNRDKENQK